MARPKTTGRSMLPRHVREKNFTKSAGKAQSKQKEGSSKRRMSLLSLRGLKGL